MVVVVGRVYTFFFVAVVIARTWCMSSERRLSECENVQSHHETCSDIKSSTKTIAFNVREKKGWQKHCAASQSTQKHTPHTATTLHLAYTFFVFSIIYCGRENENRS